MSKHWEVIIRRVDNGFITIFKGGDCSGEQVFEEKSPSLIEEDKNYIVDMLYSILEYFGELGSKHDKKRIIIRYEKP